jgi:hypothetical protein
MANPSSAIRVNELKAVIDSILTHITNDLKIDEIDLTSDYYWDIPEEQLYSTEGDPKGCTIGSLFADLEFLRSALADKDQAVALLLIHVAPLLRYVATKVGQ